MSLLTVLEDDAKSAFLTSLKTILPGDLMAIAQAAVAEVDVELAALSAILNGDALDNAKREAAKTKLLNALGAAGKDVLGLVTSDLNFLIEAAIQAGVAAALSAA